jgi:hypothetical protein
MQIETKSGETSNNQQPTSNIEHPMERRQRFCGSKLHVASYRLLGNCPSEGNLQLSTFNLQRRAEVFNFGCGFAAPGLGG